jgi:hypothetical protein
MEIYWSKPIIQTIDAGMKFAINKFFIQTIGRFEIVHLLQMKKGMSKKPLKQNSLDRK